MGDVIGELLPLAVGVAVSPVPVIAVILMLLAPHARAAGAAFAAGWVLGVALVTGLVTALVQPAGSASDDGASVVVAVLKLALGLLTLLLGVREWRSRPREGDEPELPGWMSAVDRTTPVRAAGLGAALSAVNPKNLALCISAGATVGDADLPLGDVIVSVAVFVVLASVTVVAPVLAYLVAPASMSGRLEDLRAWLTVNNSTVLAVLLLVLGVSLVGKGVAGL